MAGRSKSSELALVLALLAFCCPNASLADEQFRAFWVTGFGPGFWTPEQADQLLAEARAANLNALIVQVGRRGDAFYNDSFQPRTEEPGFQPGFDALQYLIDRAHGQSPRLEVHAWINTLVMASAAAPPQDPQHVFNLHGPQTGADHWFSERFDGLQVAGSSYFLDPGHAEAALYVVRMYAWLVARYDVDGIHLDFVRYPEFNTAGADWGYNPTAVRRFNQQFGRSGLPSPSDPDWLNWRREQVTQLVRKIYLTVTALNPRVKVSAATIAWGGAPASPDDYYASSAAYTRVLQDWLGWVREGILDLNIPMNYDRESSSTQALWFRDWIEFETAHRFNRQVVIGQGSFLNSIAETIRQLRTAFSRALGVCGFSYQTSNNEGKPFAETARALSQPSQYDAEPVPVFAAPASIPSMSWKESPTLGHLMGWVWPAQVSEINLSGPELRTLKPDGRGWFGAVDLPPGAYTVTAGGEEQRVVIQRGHVSVLNFPSSLVIPALFSSDDRFTGIAISNRGGAPVTLRLSHYGSQAQQTVSLERGTQLARLATEIFGAGLQDGWVEMEKKPGVSAFFQIGNYAQTFLDGGTEPFRTSSRLIFDRLDGLLYVINPGPEAIDLRITQYSPSGTVIRSHGLWLASKERRVLVPASGEGYLDLRAGGELSAFRWFEGAQVATGSPGLRPGIGERLYSAHFAHGELAGFRLYSRMVLINSGDRAVEVGYSLHDERGGVLAQGAVSLPPHGKKELDGSQILGVSDPDSRIPAVVGSLVLEGARDVVGTITFGDAAGGGFAAGMPLADQPARGYVFNHVANAGSFFTGLGMMNPDRNASAEILVEVYGSEGVKTGEGKVTLGPGERLSKLVKELVPQSAAQVGGYVVLSSPSEFVSFMLFATDSLSVLSALPGVGAP